MRTGEAMFRVLVLGGLALTSQEACGSTGSPADAGSDSAQNADSFPSELPAYVDANIGFGDAGNDGATSGGDGSTGDANSQDGFPQEGPPPPPPP